MSSSSVFDVDSTSGDCWNNDLEDCGRQKVDCIPESSTPSPGGKDVPILRTGVFSGGLCRSVVKEGAKLVFYLLLLREARDHIRWSFIYQLIRLTSRQLDGSKAENMGRSRSDTLDHEWSMGRTHRVAHCASVLMLRD